MAAEALAPLPLRRPGSGRTLLRCLRHLRPYRPLVLGSYALLLVDNGAALAMPLIIRTIVDQGIEGGQMGAIAWGVAALLGLTLLRCCGWSSAPARS